MARKSYKHHKKGVGHFVQLHEWFQKTEAWATLPTGPRALYIELKRRYNGSNNGRILLSHREAAEALNVHRNTVGPWFQELEARGFTVMTQGAHLGPSGVGQTSHWRLTELPTDDMKTPSKDFASWRQIQKPRTNSGPPRHNNCDTKSGLSVVK
ncbi:hypothetical protein [Marivita sp.]|uniref:hypothetical protein n=1 Tax=Marivita sp. TaxID=2003365 RepID=UPI003B525A56